MKKNNLHQKNIFLGLHRIFLLLVLFFLAGLPLHAYAAKFSISQSQNIQNSFDVMLDPQGQSVNTIDINISIPQGATIAHIEDANSIITAWIVMPHVIKDPSSGQNSVQASGIIAQGFTGVRSPFYAGVRPGLLFRIIFSSLGSSENMQKNSSNSLSFIGARALLNDGQGTETNVVATSFSLDNYMQPILPTPSVSSSSTFLPDIFTPFVTRSFDVAENKWFVVFHTTDHFSGINHYEIQESPITTSTDKWIEATSPYVLQDQSLKSFVLIKAVNNNGGQRIAIVSPQATIGPWYTLGNLWNIISTFIVLIIILGIASIFLR